MGADGSRTGRRTRAVRRVPSTSAVLLACAIGLSTAATASGAGLCGDTGGDGFFTASDALVTLKLSVEGGYDRRGDVFPEGGGDGSIDSRDALATLKAVVENRTPLCHGVTARHAVVSTAADNFSSGGFAFVDIATRSFWFRGGSLSTDSVARAPLGIPVVVNRRASSSLQFLDTTKPSLPNVKECSVSNGSDTNSQDVVFVSPTKGYVTAYEGRKLVVVDPRVLFDPKVDPACKGIITGHIDLSSFDSDGFPQMDQMVLVGSDLFVSLQILDEQFQPRENVPSRIAVIDTATDTVKGSIPLAFRNPFAATKGLPYDEFQKRIFVGGPGKVGIDLDDGGIEAIDPATMQSDGLLLSGADLHADIFDFVVAGSARIFAIVADETSNSVIDIDLATHTTKVLLSSKALITDIEMTETGELWVAYRGETLFDLPGLRIFRVLDDFELTAAPAKPIILGQAPFSIAFTD
jgi:hypothetical protein